MRPSPIADDGLLARASIAAGTIVSRLGGQLVTSSELSDMLGRAALRSNPDYIDTITVTHKLQLVLPPGRPNGKGNHSCEPNLWWVSSYSLATRRDVAVDEELKKRLRNKYGQRRFHHGLPVQL